MKIFILVYQRIRNVLWAIIVAYMLGLHNMYRQEQKSPDDIVIKIIDDAGQEDNAPKD